MTRPRPDTLFRLGALVGCAIIVLPYVTRLLAGDGVAADHGIGTRLVFAAGPLSLAVVFGAAFWHTSRGPAGSRRLTIALFALQVVLGLFISDFYFLIAAEAPFVFSPRGAFLWIAAQLAAFAVLVVVVA